MAGAGTLLLPLLSILLVSGVSAFKGIGANWGTMASHTLHPKTIVGMLRDNGLDKVKLFDSDPWTVKFFAGTGIEVMLAIPNNMLADMSKDYDNAKHWVEKNVTVHRGKVDIGFVAVGNEPFLKSYNGTFQKTTFPAMRNVQRALNEAGHSKIKVTCPLNADVYDSGSNKPSAGAFRKDIQKEMHEIVRFLRDNDAAFVVNIYPFLSLYDNPDFPFDFAFCDNRGKPVDDKGVDYKNVFDANHDTLVWALRKAGAPDLKIMIGEIGWPTDGDKSANVKLARRFYDAFFKKISGPERGTPLRPGTVPVVYIFGLVDEDEKSIAPGDFERHWGVFRYDGQPKFPIDFRGDGQERMPVGAKGVQYLEEQWCVADREVVSQNKSGVNPIISYACENADCTALGYGSSCNNLDSYGNISYGFNMYFQSQDQSEPACNFDGMGKIVKQNVSRDGCLFPIQIVQSAGERLRWGAAAGILALLLALL